MPTVNDIIVYCQKQIKKEPPAEKLLHYLSRLNRLRITIDDLKDTHIGRTVNQLSRHDGDVGHVARKLVKKWKKMVSDENPEESADSQSSSSEESDEDEEEGEGSDRESHEAKNLVNKYHDVNGNRTKVENPQVQHQHFSPPRDEYYGSGSDSDSSDRLCIADEAGGEGSKNSTSNSSYKLSSPIPPIQIKSEKILPSDSEGSDADLQTQILQTQIITRDSNENSEHRSHSHHKESRRDRDRHHDEANKHNKHVTKVKTERLSESEGGLEEEVEAESSSFQKNKRLNHNHRDRNRGGSGSGSEDSHRDHEHSSRSNSINHDKIKKEKDEEKEKHRRTHSSERTEKRRHRSEHKEKHKKEKHHSKEAEKDKKREKEGSSSKNIIKIKIEPPSSPNYESYNHSQKSKSDEDSSSKHHEKSRKKSKERREKEESHHKKKEHKKKRDRETRDERSSKKFKEETITSSTIDSENKRRHEKEKERLDRKRSESGRPEQTAKDSSLHSSSPDRKKLRTEESLTKKDKSKDRDRSPSKKASIHIDKEIDSTSGVKFDELLGCLDTTLQKQRKHKDKDHKEKEKSGKSKHTSKDKDSSSSRKDKEREEVTKLVRRKDMKVEEKKKNKHLQSVIAPTLNISPNYKPSAAAALLARPKSIMPPRPLPSSLILDAGDTGNYWEDSRITLANGCKETSAEDALSVMMSNRNQRTKVYSGNKAVPKGIVPRLYDMCMQVIQENIHELGCTGGVPYDILKPALERATSEQLISIEHCNPYLIGDTDELWKFHCKQEYQGRERQEMESWRELFERCQFERDQKFAIVKRKMLKKADVAEPSRKAKLAYVEAVGGPRLNKEKAAMIKNGMRTLKMKEEKGGRKNVMSSASAAFNNPTSTTRMITEDAVIINPDSRGHGPGSSRGRGGGGDGESTARIKPRKAPLMAKTMKFIRTLQRR